MTDCAECGRHDRLPYTCNRCGSRFCPKHRLPEAHECTGLSAQSGTQWFRRELSAQYTRRSILSDTDTVPPPNPEPTPLGTPNRELGTIGTALSFVLLPFMLAFMLLRWLLRHWKLALVCAIVIVVLW